MGSGCSSDLHNSSGFEDKATDGWQKMRGPGVKANIDVSCQTKHQITALGNSPQQPKPVTALPSVCFPFPLPQQLCCIAWAPDVWWSSWGYCGWGKLQRDQARTSGHRRTQVDEMGSRATMGSTLWIASVNKPPLEVSGGEMGRHASPTGLGVDTRRGKLVLRTRLVTLLFPVVPTLDLLHVEVPALNIWGAHPTLAAPLRKYLVTSTMSNKMG